MVERQSINVTWFQHHLRVSKGSIKSQERWSVSEALPLQINGAASELLISGRREALGQQTLLLTSPALTDANRTKTEVGKAGNTKHIG